MVCIFNHVPRLTWSTFDEMTLLVVTSEFVCVCVCLCKRMNMDWILYSAHTQQQPKKKHSIEMLIDRGVKTFLRKLTNRWSLVMII